MPLPLGADGGTIVAVAVAGVVARVGVPTTAAPGRVMPGRATPGRAAPTSAATAASGSGAMPAPGTSTATGTTASALWVTRPTARTCATVRRPGPEGPKAVTATTVSALAARPTRRRTRPDDLRLTESSIPVRRVIVAPHRRVPRLPQPRGVDVGGQNVSCRRPAVRFRRRSAYGRSGRGHPSNDRGARCEGRGRRAAAPGRVLPDGR